jgi:hypothetical protein
MIEAKAMAIATLSTKRSHFKKGSSGAWDFRFRGSGRLVGMQTRHQE